MATDLAEFLGGAIGLSLLLHCTLMAGMAITALASYALLLLQRGGFRPMEIAIGGFVGAIGLCYLVELFLAPVDWGAAALGAATPSLPDAQALTLCVAIIGATLMPHAVFLHSSLMQERAQPRSEAERRKLLRYSNREVVAALGLAGLVNMAMMAAAAAAFHESHADVADIASAYLTLTPLLGAAAGSVFLLALLASGLSSSTVGTMSGQMVMQGFLGVGIPLWLRRAVTMIPAFIVVWLGVDSTRALIMSQVVLSFALPAPLVPLILFTRKSSLMGPYVNGRWTDAAAILGGAVVLALNAVLLAQSLGVDVPGLPAG
jgi:manganese transport protein